MDPFIIKQLQYVLAELLGVALVAAGIWQSYRALSGKSQVLLQLPGMKARVTNATPGAVLALVGLAMVALSLHYTLHRETESGAVTAGDTQTGTQPGPVTSGPTLPVAQPGPVTSGGTQTGPHIKEVITMSKPDAREK